MMPVAMQSDLVGKTVEIRAFTPYAHNPPDHDGVPGIPVAIGVLRAIGTVELHRGSEKYTYPTIVLVVETSMVNVERDQNTLAQPRRGFLVSYLISHSIDGEDTLSFRVVEPKP